MGLRLGDTAPDFEVSRLTPMQLGLWRDTADIHQAQTNKGPIKFHDYIKDSWALFFSHPADYTPVCTTELGALAGQNADFDALGVKLVGLSADDVESHQGWIKDIKQFSGNSVDFPIVADADRKVSVLYDMLDQQDATNIDAKGIPFTVRSVFVIDPQQKIRLILTYPASTGRNWSEVQRAILSLQLGDKKKITTPANWTPGDKVIVHPSVQGDQVKELFGDQVETVFPYLRFTKVES